MDWKSDKFTQICTETHIESNKYSDNLQYVPGIIGLPDSALWFFR